MQREVELSIYTQELFTTDHDEANRAAVAEVSAGELDLVGSRCAPNEGRHKVLDRLRPHP